MPHLLRLITTLLLCCPVVLAQAKENQLLRVIISDHQTAPYVLRENGQISGGILKELVDELARRLNLKVRYIPLPRKRLDQALASGDVHLHPSSNPTWRTSPLKLQWSQPWLEFEDRFVQLRSNRFTLQEFDDLKGKRLGTILGHHYPELEFWLEHHFIYRDDALTPEQNFKKLAAGRIDALIDSRTLINYQLKHHPAPEQFELSPLIATRNQYFLALTPSAPCTIEEISAALQQMLDEEIVEQILDRYR